MGDCKPRCAINCYEGVFFSLCFLEQDVTMFLSEREISLGCFHYWACTCGWV